MNAGVSQSVKEPYHIAYPLPASNSPPGKSSGNRIFTCVNGAASGLPGVLRSFPKICSSALTPVAVTWLFLATLFFLPCLIPEVVAQTAESSVVTADLLTRRAMVAEEARNIVKAIPVGPPSRLLGTELPTSVDLRNELPPVGHQGDGWTQACVVFATVYYQMSQLVKHFLHPSWDPKNPEHQFSVTFTELRSGNGYARDTYQSLQQWGSVDTAEMQYHAPGRGAWPEEKITASLLEAAKPYRIGGYAALWENGNGPQRVYRQFPFDNHIENAKAWLADGFVLSSTVGPGEPNFPDNHCNSPAFFYDPGDVDLEYVSGHGVAIVGYNDNINPTGNGPDHQGGFLMVNSFGPNWNGDMHGYLWLSYDYVKRFVPDCWIMVPGRSDKPVITGYGYAEDGTQLRIRGRNFGAYRRLAEVRFNGIAAGQTISWTNELVTVTWQKTCPPSSPIVVYNWEGVPSKPFALKSIQK
jgi:hypothetical protein